MSFLMIFLERTKFKENMKQNRQELNNRIRTGHNIPNQMLPSDLYQDQVV